jgi:hypothetical protein
MKIYPQIIKKNVEYGFKIPEIERNENLFFNSQMNES